MIKHVDITITGKVQGVGFRYCALDEAIELGLSGVVKNVGKNQIVIAVEGEVENLKKFLRFCHQGPQGAQIEKVDYTSTETLQDYEEFTIEFE